MIDPIDYWVNNTLITPINKALMYDSDIDGALSRERERIIALIEAAKKGLTFGPDRQLVDNMIALIKGENE